MQRALGFKGKAVDGDYGPDTAGAVEEWKWRKVGYPKRQINNRLGLLGIAWLLGEVPPRALARNAKARKGKPYALNGIVRPLDLAGLPQRVRARRRRGSAGPERRQAPRRQGLVRAGRLKPGSARRWPGRSSRRSFGRRPPDRSSAAA